MSRLYTYLQSVSSSCHCKDVASAESSCLEVTTNLLPLNVATTDSTNPFGNKVSSITPFSAWTISLPPTTSNEDIKFEEISSQTESIIQNFYEAQEMSRKFHWYYFQDSDFKAPKLQFYLNNSNSAQVTFPIKKVTEYSLFIKGEWVTVDS